MGYLEEKRIKEEVNLRLHSLGFEVKTIDDEYRVELLAELNKRFSNSIELKTHLDKLDNCCGKEG
jgi:hypothetical protein